MKYIESPYKMVVMKCNHCDHIDYLDLEVDEICRTDYFKGAGLQCEDFREHLEGSHFNFGDIAENFTYVREDSNFKMLLKTVVFNLCKPPLFLLKKVSYSLYVDLDIWLRCKQYKLFYGVLHDRQMQQDDSE